MLKFLFATGIVGELLPIIVIGGFVQFVYANVFMIDPAYVSIVWTLYSVFKFFAMFYIGLWLDGTTVSLSLIYWVTSMVSLFAFIWLWNPLSVAWNTPNILLIELVSSLFIFGFASCTFLLAKGALFQNLFVSEERAKVAGIQQLLTIIGVVGGMVAPPLLSNDWKDMPWMTSVLVASYLISIVPCGVAINFIQAESSKNSTEEKKTLSKQSESLYKMVFEPLLKNKRLFQVVFANLLAQLAFQSLLSTIQLYIKLQVPGVKEVLVVGSFEFDTKIQIGIAQLSGQIASMVATPFWIAQSKSLGHGRLWAIGTLGFATTLIIQFLFQTGTFSFLLINQVVAGIFTPNLFFVPMIALSEIVDEHKEKTGENRTGQYQGIFAMAIILSQVVQAGLSTLTYLCTDDPIAISNTIVIFVPTLSMVASAMVMLNFSSPKEKKE